MDEHALTVKFWGTRGSIPTPGFGTERYGGNTACVSVVAGQTLLILDAGTGIRNLGLDLLSLRQADPCHKPCYHLVLSHTHWDHIQGLPFFAPVYTAGTELTIYGRAQRHRFLHRILRGQMNANVFPVQMSMLQADVKIREISDETIRIGAVTIQVQSQFCHPGGTLRFRIAYAGRSLVYATDVDIDECPPADRKRPARQEEISRYRAFIEGADLLIGDGQYSAEEHASKRGWGHSAIPTLIRTAAEVSVKQVAVFHHDPDHDDKQLDDFVARYAPGGQADSGTTGVFWAREGLTVHL